MSTRVIICDTTLRDGEQSPGATMNLPEKLRMARQLESLGVDVIEAGFPASSVGDFEAVHAIANAVTDVQVAALARCNKNDIDRAWQALNGARNPRIHVFLATSPRPINTPALRRKASIFVFSSVPAFSSATVS